MLRGPDTAGLQSDLAKVELRLRRLEADDTFSPAEHELEERYFTHWRNRLHSFLEKDRARIRKAGQETEGVGRISSSHVKAPGESWKAITPDALVRAVLNIRGDFEQLSDGQRDFARGKCFKELHELTNGMTEPMVFKKHFYACIERLRQIVASGFARFLEISLKQGGIIGAASVHWASLQMTDLIEREDRLVENWIKSVCDKRDDLLTTSSEEFMDKIAFRTDWRAPRWLVMQPNGNSVYDRSTAWERMNEADTKRILTYLRENRWILLLESALSDIAGISYETLAKREASTPDESATPSTKPPETASRSSRKPLMLQYRSPIKRAILWALSKNPTATDAEVCRLLDADGAEELPPGWKNRKEDRSFFAAYANPRWKRKIEITISKIRRDLRDRGLLQ